MSGLIERLSIKGLIACKDCSSSARHVANTETYPFFVYWRLWITRRSPFISSTRNDFSVAWKCGLTESGFRVEKNDFTKILPFVYSDFGDGIWTPKTAVNARVVHWINFEKEYDHLRVL